MELKESLEICLKMWRFIENQKDFSNIYSLKNEFCRENDLDIVNECPGCEYQESFDFGEDFGGDDDCEINCPMLGLWPNGCCGGDEKTTWKRARDAKTQKTRAKYAKIIADFAEAELKRLF